MIDHCVNRINKNFKGEKNNYSKLTEDDVLNIGYKVAVQDLASQTRAVSLFSRDQDFPSDFVSAYYYLQKQKPKEKQVQIH